MAEPTVFSSYVLSSCPVAEIINTSAKELEELYMGRSASVLESTRKILIFDEAIQELIAY